MRAKFYLSFMIGASGAAFNFWEIEIESNGTLASFSKSKRTLGSPDKKVRKREEVVPPSEADAISSVFESKFNLTIPEMSYAQVPNPFVGVSSASAYTQTAPYLNMVDGSEGGQTIPLWGQIQPARAVNFIIAWEDNNDAPPYGWSNGTNLYHTYLQASAAGLPFPIVPPFSTFIHRRWFERPVFFGCDKRLTTTGDSNAPIVLYLAHAPYSAYLNYTADQGVMSPQQMDDIFLNGFNQLTQGNGTLDHEWPVCLGCAAIERSLEKAGMDTPEQCRRCFEKYCWDGNSMDEKDVGIVNPTLVLDHKLGYLQWLAEHEYWNATLAYQE
jgi:lysophospholipase